MGARATPTHSEADNRSEERSKETSAGIIFLLNVVYIKLNNRIGLNFHLKHMESKEIHVIQKQRITPWQQHLQNLSKSKECKFSENRHGTPNATKINEAR